MLGEINKIIENSKKVSGYFLCIGSTGYDLPMSKNNTVMPEENIPIRKRKTGPRND